MISIIGDMHLDESSIDEINLIIDEILEKNPKASGFWFLGDILDKKRPTPIEYEAITKILVKLQKIASVLIITGNHDDLTNKISSIDYSKHFGIKVYNFKTIQKIGKYSVYLGHHFTDKGEQFKKNDLYKVKDLAKKYDLTLLGHDHCYRELAPNVFHLGSIRRQHFGEVDYGVPQYATLCLETLEMGLFDVSSAVPMIDVFSMEEALKIDSRAKVRLVFKDFEDYLKNINKLPVLQKKFHTFKIFHDYVQKVKNVKKEVKAGKSFEEMFGEYLLKNVKNKEVEKLIKENL